MAQRLELQALLRDILGAENVYFQPPETIVMQYPCIVYRRDSASTIHADDRPYNQRYRYQVMVIDQNPDSDIPDKVAALPMCRYDRFYTVNNLNHDVFKLFF